MATAQQQKQIKCIEIDELQLTYAPFSPLSRALLLSFIIIMATAQQQKQIKCIEIDELQLTYAPFSPS